MKSLAIFFILCSIVSGLFLAWMHTRRGKKWLNSL